MQHPQDDKKQAVKAIRDWAQPTLKPWESQHGSPMQFMERFITFVRERVGQDPSDYAEVSINTWSDESRSEANHITKKGVCVQFANHTGAPIILTGSANVPHFLGLTSAFKMGEMFSSPWSLNGCISYHKPNHGSFIGTVGNGKMVSLVTASILAESKAGGWALRITDLKYIANDSFSNYYHLFPTSVIQAYFDTYFAGKKISHAVSAARVGLTHDPEMGIFAYVPARGVLMYCSEKFHTQVANKMIIVPGIISIRAAECIHHILSTGETSLAGVEGGSILSICEINQVISTLEFLGVHLA